ncbi:HNH endonuclease signature motif containing protein [Sinorhizobium meliloti]|uniref:HNH endonuclease signature motif containing protein n=1 Tax=Rhizobium meliloti TaxID=382 RepID=UPI00398CB22F
MSAESFLSFAQVNSVLGYEAESGLLFWKERPRSMFTTEGSWKIWNARFAGKEAFTSFKDGYKRGCIFYRHVRAHRVAWMLSHGVWPSGEIDHIDGDRANNKLENLRDVPGAENRKNARRPRNNISGVVGVSWRKDTRKWSARVKIGGRVKCLGDFKSFDEAVATRKLAESKYGFHENHGRL